MVISKQSFFPVPSVKNTDRAAFRPNPASHLRSGSVYLYAFVAFGEFVALLIGLSLVE